MENNINRIIELHHNKSDDSFKELSSLINGKNGTYIKKLNKRFSFLNIKINGSTGKGGRSKVPWICFFDDKKDTHNTAFTRLFCLIKIKTELLSLMKKALSDIRIVILIKKYVIKQYQEEGLYLQMI